MYELSHAISGDGGPRLTLATIVVIDGQNLASLLADAASWTDEIVVGITAATAAVREEAEAAGARVVDLDWQHDFSLARNAVLARCSGEWILSLDTDERLAAPDWAELRRWIESHRPAQQPRAARLPTRSYVPGHYSRRGWRPVSADDPHGLPTGAPSPGYVPATKVRLLPNLAGLEYRGRLHESVENSLKEACVPVVDLPWPVHHFGLLEPDPRRSVFYRDLARLKTTDSPHDFRAWADLAECAIMCRDLQEALSAVDRALVLNPTDVERRLTAGWLLKELGELSAADLQLAAVAGSCQLTDTQLAETCHLRAQIAMLQERPADASPLLAIALRLYPENGFYLTTLGVWHLHMGRQEQARLALEKAVALCPECADALLNLGLLHASARRTQPAIDYLQRALTLDRDCQDAERALTRLLPTPN